MLPNVRASTSRKSHYSRELQYYNTLSAERKRRAATIIIDRRTSGDASAANGSLAFAEIPSANQPTTFAIFNTR